MSSQKKKGLGRGLDALLGGAVPDLSKAGQGSPLQQTLAVKNLQAGRYQPRQAMDDSALAELADSIRSQGVMQPLLVRPLDPGSPTTGYEIIAGERRFRAAQLAGLTELPVIIREVDDQAALAMALIENLQREDLTALEEAQGIDRLIREFGLTHEQAAVAVGRSRSATSNLLRLLQLPEALQKMLAAKEIDAGHARALLPLSGAHQRMLAQKIIAEGLSVREAEKFAARYQAEPTSGAGKKSTAPAPSRDWLRVSDQLSDLLGLPVVLKPGRGSRGELVVRFSNFEELDGLIRRVAPEGLESPR